MTRTVLAVFALATLVSCTTVSGTFSRINPFSDADAEAQQTGEDAANQEAAALIDRIPNDGRAPVDLVVAARLEYTPSGAIVRADGEPGGRGYHSAQLRAVNFGTPDENGTLWYDFRVAPPSRDLAPGAARAQSISAATFIPDTRLRRISGVGVRGATNEVFIRVR